MSYSAKPGPLHLAHERIQHSVGQGGFHSAKVEVQESDGRRYRFDYVYDCGAAAHSEKSALRASIDRLALEPREDAAERRVIDALMLSHYDQDHIVGAKQLIERFVVRRVFLPYLWADELMVVLASQAASIRAVQVQELHALATNSSTTFFGVPVTRVMPTGPQSDLARPEEPPAAPSDAQLDGAMVDRQAEDGPARPAAPGAAQAGPPAPGLLHMEVGSGQALGVDLLAQDDLWLRVPGALHRLPWQLRFWNRGISDKLVQQLKLRLYLCGFPLKELQDAKGLGVLLSWLRDPVRRDKAVAAYEASIKAAGPSLGRAVASKHVANHLSMGLYSGPDGPLGVAKANYWVRHTKLDTSGSLCHYCQCPRVHNGLHPSEFRLGWLGTGDAPLGESDIWADFAARYSVQLHSVVSVQVPHHGAAPRGGPAFFNSDLLPAPCMNAVLSVGQRNSYAHPRAAVLAAVRRQGGLLRRVDDRTAPGFIETVELEFP